MFIVAIAHLLVGAVAGETTAALVQRAQQAYAQLEYDQVLPLAQAVLARADATLEQRLDIYVIQGSALAIIGDIVAAEKPFRFLLRGRPDFDLPKGTPPKILATFRKVQAEERAIVEQTRELERERIVSTLRINGKIPEQAPGGKPIRFDYQLQDPRGAVADLSVKYRKRGVGGFSSLSLQRDASGRWLGDLSGDFTANEHGATIEYYVATLDTQGRGLLDIGSAAQPQVIALSAGTIERSRPVYKSPWFWVGMVAGAAAVATASAVIYVEATALPHSDLGTHAVR